MRGVLHSFSTRRYQVGQFIVVMKTVANSRQRVDARQLVADLVDWSSAGPLLQLESVHAAIVQPQVGVALVRLRTHLTGERLLAGVHSHVRLQVHVRPDALVAHYTHKRLIDAARR